MSDKLTPGNSSASSSGTPLHLHAHRPVPGTADTSLPEKAEAHTKAEQKSKNPWGEFRIGSGSGFPGQREEPLETPEEAQAQNAFDYFVIIDDNPNEFDLWRKPDEPRQEEAREGEDNSRLMCWEHCTTGYCSTGEECQYVHGDYCETCQKYCLDQNDAEARQQHQQECRVLHDRLQAYLKSTELECAICLEKVLNKANISDRRFGLMSCDHIFCLPCIRNWRSADDGSVDVASALRTCPVCRVATHFVTPSTVFPANDAEKSDIIEGYKNKMAEIDCKHFNFGEGRCPFVNSCFYRHAYRDGTLADIAVRKAANSDGELRFVSDKISLGDLMQSYQHRRNGGRRL